MPEYSPSEFSRTHTMSMSRAPAVGERRREAGQQPHRAEVHVLVEALPKRQNQLPHRHVIGDPWRADRAEVDGVERRKAVEPVFVHHPVVLQVVFAPPRQLGEGNRGRRSACDRFDCGHPRRNHFAADAVAGDDRDLKLVIGCHCLVAASVVTFAVCRRETQPSARPRTAGARLRASGRCVVPRGNARRGHRRRTPRAL